MNKNYVLSEFLIPEIIGLEKRMDKSYKWVSKNRNKIDKNISFFESMNLFDLGIDVTQLK